MSIKHTPDPAGSVFNNKDVGIFAQGYGKEGSDEYVKGTNTCFFMDFDKIQNIPKNQVCTYARIMVDYRPQKKMTKTESELQRKAT